MALSRTVGAFLPVLCAPHDVGLLRRGWAWEICPRMGLLSLSVSGIFKARSCWYALPRLVPHPSADGV